MDLIQMARELGAALQQDARYLEFMQAHEDNEKDIELQGLIGKIQLVHMSYNREAAKDDKDEEKLKEYDRQFNSLYNEVMCNPHMRRFEKARDEADKLMKEITGILTLCMRGEDPMTCDPNAGSCGGDCGSCGGCG
jgi:cell fate (sporulation/competence/biofilm development) regulator YmcA (YheA/YmcA/DUF963 family)